MYRIKNQIKKIFSPTTTSGSWGLNRILSYIPMPPIKPPKKEEDSFMNMTPNKCGDCKWIYKQSRNFHKCYFNPPQVVYKDSMGGSGVISYRPTVRPYDKGCSKFGRHKRWELDYDDNRLKEGSGEGC